MMRTFLSMLGEDAGLFRRYVWLAAFYGLLSGLAISLTAPTFCKMLQADLWGAAPWLLLQTGGVLLCWLLRRQVEKAGIGVGLAVLGGVRQRLGDHVARLPVGWFTAENTARLSHILTHGMMEIAQLPAHVITPLLSGALAPVVLVGSLFLLDGVMGLIALLTLPLMVGVFFLSARFGRQADIDYQRSAALTSHRAVEFAQTQSVLRAFNVEGGGARFLDAAIDRQNATGRRLIWLTTLSVVLNSWVLHGVFALFLILAAMRLNGQAPAAAMVAMVLALIIATRFIEPLLDIAGYGAVVRAARNHLEEIEHILTVKPLPEPAVSKRPQDASVEVCDVSFRYRPDGQDVLQDVSLSVEPGGMLALIGASGSGKSTLLRLIARFFDVGSGRICVGGVDIREMSASDLAMRISQVFQDNWLFQGSIAENIRIGNPDATTEEFDEAVQLAGVEEIIHRLPGGLDTIVGEGGARLSGGERQRVAIARALIKNAPILLLDEATAALDAENQQAIGRALLRLRGRRTLIVIAHQLSTVSMADAIVVLEEGRIVESGTHDSLQRRNGPYQAFLGERWADKGWRISVKS